GRGDICPTAAGRGGADPLTYSQFGPTMFQNIVWGVAMLSRIIPLSLCLLFFACPAGRARDDVPHIAMDKVDRVRIVIGSNSKGACKLDYERLTTSIKFILNTANIPFVDGWPEAQPVALSDETLTEMTRQEQMPILTVFADLLPTNSGCIYTV